MGDLLKKSELNYKTGMQVIGGIFREYAELQERLCDELSVPEILNSEVAKKMIWDAYNELKYSLLSKKCEVEVAYDVRKKVIRLGIFDHDDKGDLGKGQSIHNVITIGSEYYEGKNYFCRRQTLNKVVRNPWEKREEVTIFGNFEIFENDGNKVGERIYEKEYSRSSDSLRRAVFIEIFETINLKDLLSFSNFMHLFENIKNTDNIINHGSTKHLNRVLYPQNGILITTKRTLIPKKKKEQGNTILGQSPKQLQVCDNTSLFEEEYLQHLSCSDWDEPHNFELAKYHEIHSRYATFNLQTLKFIDLNDGNFSTMQEAAKCLIDEYHDYLEQNRIK